MRRPGPASDAPREEAMTVPIDPTRPWIEPDRLGSPAAEPGPERNEEAAPQGVAPGRREFLKLTGIGAAAALAACRRLPVEQSLPYLVPPEDVVPGVPVRYASTCTACPASCGLLVSCLDGRPVKLEGRPDHPLSGGGLCALGQGDLRGLYDAGRLRAPRLLGREAAWEEVDAHVEKALAELRGGTGRVAVLTTTIVSPTARAAVEAFLAPFGGRLVEHDAEAKPVSALLDAEELLRGTPRLPYPELARTDLLVVLGADPLGTGWDPVGFTRAWAARRADGSRPAFRHVQAEGCLSLTGAAADERLVLSAAERRALALALLRSAAEASDDPAAPAVAAALAGLPPAADGALAAELGAARGRSLVLSGSDDVAEQVAVALLNRFLGNDGATVDRSRPSLVRRGRDGALSALLAAVEAGEVEALFVVGLDAVDQLPEGDRLAAALKKLPLSVAVTDRPTATAAACGVVASAHHGLECWGDAEPRAGVVTLAQPAVRPLFGTRPPWEPFLRWAGVPDADWRTHLKESWRTRLGAPADFEARFTEAVRSGRAPERAGVTAATAPFLAAAAPVVPEAAVRLVGGAASAPAPPELAVELLAEVGMRDGSRAHVPWLRELPDPLTRVSWSPCVRVAPDRARALGVSDGDVVRVETGSGRSVTLPVRIQPGQHPSVLGVPVGYGRRDGDEGRAERNGYRLAAVDGTHLVTSGLPARVARTGERVALPLMQPTGDTHGRPVVRQVAARDERLEPAHHIAPATLWPERKPTSPKWEMVVDLDACTGCGGCVVACQAENNLPVVGEDEIRRSRDMYWLRVDRYFLGDPAAPDVLFEPMLCAQCDNAPCETVCPVAATVHSEDGLNQQVYNRCVGTRYCANNCPYKVRRFNWFDYPVKEPVERLVLNPNVVVRSRGVMEKCTFCVQRIQAERIASRRAGREDWRGGGVETACQQSCPARAIAFGDGTDPEGEVARRKGSPRAFQVLEELGIGPAVTYLAKVRTRPGHAEKGGAEG